ncbi:MAG: peptidyl-prolyl cis-trans isomerase [Sideroxydans sp.]|nr:peptidyl-prolyl cis-trans isomerase [Sideroxydans sp.]
MLKSNKILVAALLGAFAMNAAYAAEKSAALVNGVSIAQARVDMAVQTEVAQGQTDSPELRKSIRENLIKRELMLQEAAKMGLDKTPEALQEIDLAKQSVLINAYLMDYMKKNPISDEVLKQEYETRKAKLGGKEYNARHILVETEAEAKAIIVQLSKKVKFEKLVAQSKDVGSAAQGGSLGWAAPANFVPPFAAALQSLKKGEYTKTPVQTQFGWHVIQVQDERAMKIPAFEEVKPQLQQRLQQQAIQKQIMALEAKAKIE